MQSPRSSDKEEMTKDDKDEISRSHRPQKADCDPQQIVGVSNSQQVQRPEDVLRCEQPMPPRLNITRKIVTDDKNKISKANRPRARLCDRRRAKQLDSKTPPKYILCTKRSLADRNPEFAQKISQMRLTIAPIIHVATGRPAPEYPHTMLSFFTLTEAQLDALAQYYSQTNSLDVLKYQYPQTMDWAAPFLEHDPALPDDCKLTEMERLKVKMRMFARFIGMRGADTPSWEYERQVEILGNKISHLVRQEEEKSRFKEFRGLGRY
ncbi:hypothetical protein G6514_006076 [Epicoccum nigrum]|nr:hypothetical protein G6514_006076 [Epicoccum nigrum]